MRILFLCPYPPYPPRSGGALRIYNLLAGLAARHDIWCLTFVPDDAAIVALEPLRSLCHVVPVPDRPRRGLLQRAWTTLTSPLPDMALRNASPVCTDALRRVLGTQQFDVVQVASIEMARYGLEMSDWKGQVEPERARPTFVLDEFNAEYVLQRRAALTDLAQVRAAIPNPRSLAAGLYSLVQWGKLAHYERRLLRAYDHVLAVSEEDRHALLRLFPSAPISVIPNGVDTTYFAPTPPQSPIRAVPAIVFTGTLDFRPNIDAVTWFAQQVLPRVRARQPATRFVVVGRSPAAAVRALHDGSAVEIVGEVADVRPYVSGAAVYVVPMRMGGGVRLKLLEALAMQAPVVSTTMGAEGVPELCDGTHLLLADTPDAFAGAILLLLGDSALGERLGRQGRALVRAHYDWRVIVPRLEAVYAGLVATGSSASS